MDAPSRQDAGAAPEYASSNYLIIHESDLYWLDPLADVVMRTPRAGGASTVLGDASVNILAPLQLHEGELFWVDAVGSPQRFFLMRLPIWGGEPVRVVETGEHDSYGSFAIDAGFAFYTHGVDVEREVIKRLDLASGEATTIDTALYALALQTWNGQLFGSTCAGYSGGVTNNVWRLDEGVRVRLSTGAYCPTAMQARLGEVFYLDTHNVDGPSLYRVPTEGGETVRVGPSDSVAFAVHRGSAFVIFDQVLSEISLGGGSRMLREVGSVGGIAVDDEFVYWTEEAGDRFEVRTIPR